MTDENNPKSENFQSTQPKKPGAEPIEIPVPTREDFLRDLKKVAPPAPKQPKGDDATRGR